MSPEVLDTAPEVDAGLPADAATDTTIDTGIDAPPDTDGADEPPAPTDPTTPSATDGPAVSDGKLTQAGREELQRIAKTNPKLARSIRSALLEADAFRRELPGGLKDLATMRQQMEEYGGPDAIAKTREELNYFSQLDEQYTAGDPRFIQAMIDTPEGKQGFLKLAPAMLDKFREISPEFHDVYVAKYQAQNMVDSDLRYNIVRMKDMIDRMPDSPEKTGVLQEWAAVGNYYNAVVARASAKPEVPKSAAPQEQGQDERAKFESEKQAFTRKQWTTEATATATTMVNSEVDRIAAARKLTSTQKAVVLELGVARLTKKLAGIPSFGLAAQRYLANGDQAGFLKHVTSAWRTSIPNVFREVADSVVAKAAGSTPGKAAPTVNGSAAQPKVAAPITAKPSEGYSWVNAQPHKTTIDFAKTNGLMIREGKAVLTSGKRVQWRAL